MSDHRSKLLVNTPECCIFNFDVHFIGNDHSTSCCHSIILSRSYINVSFHSTMSNVSFGFGVWSGSNRFCSWSLISPPPPPPHTHTPLPLHTLTRTHACAVAYRHARTRVHDRTFLNVTVFFQHEILQHHATIARFRSPRSGKVLSWGGGGGGGAVTATPAFPHSEHLFPAPSSKFEGRMP